MTTWTWMVYMATNNDVEPFGKKAIGNIETATPTDNPANSVRVVVQQATTTSSVRRMIGANPEIVQDLGQIDSADPATVLDFVRWAVATAPAQRYALIIWSHGSGWEPSQMEKLAAAPPPPAILHQHIVLPIQPSPQPQLSLPPHLPHVLEPLAQQRPLLEATQLTKDIAPPPALLTHFGGGGGGDGTPPVVNFKPVTFDELTKRKLSDGSSTFFSTSMSFILHLSDPTTRAIAFDNGSGHALDTIELGNVMSGIVGILGQQVDLLGMNACLMSSIEVAYQVRSYAKLYVASENLMPVDGWPYDDILTSLRNQPDIDGIALGKLVVEKYCTYFSTGQNATPHVTLTALQLASIERVADTVSAFAAALQKDLGTLANAFLTAQQAIPSFRFHLYDLVNYCQSLLAQAGIDAEIAAAAQAMITALADPAFVIAFGHVDQQDASGGVSTYLMPPLSSLAISPYYGETDYAKATGWGAFLQAFRTALQN